MNQQAQPSPKEHHFYVAIAKFLFHYPEHGIAAGDTVTDCVILWTQAFNARGIVLWL